MKRELIYMDAKSSKFWNIELTGNEYTVTYGRTGSAGQKLTKTFANEAAAQKEAEKLTNEKLGKGYVDSGEYSLDSANSATSAERLIPLVAFSSINRRDDISNNAGTFIGKRVIDFDPEKPAKSDVIYRFRSDWDNDELIPNLEKFFEMDAAAEATGLVIGAWHGDDSEKTPAEVIGLLVKASDRLPKLGAIYLGDITSEENEMSWIQQCDVSDLLKAFPKLQLLRTRGGAGLRINEPKHANLRGLALETGGMDVSVIRSVCSSDFPNLEYLELWLGTDEYGANHSVADLQPIFSGRLFPKLKYLGLRNAQIADDLAAVAVNSPLLERIETLDLSLGVLTDEGGKALLKLPKSATLQRLNLHYNYLSSEVSRKLKELPLIVDTSRPSDMEVDDEWRFVAVGE